MSTIYRRLYYRVIREQASKGLRHIDIETYNLCNLKCKMCPYPSMTREKVRMSIELFKKIIDDAVATRVRSVCLNNCNEPLLDNLLVERIKYAKSRGLEVSFTSNGTLLTDDKAEALLGSGIDAVNFSFDGATKETYERIRVGANFEKTQNNIIRLIKERDRRGLTKPTVCIFIVAQKNNFHQVEKVKTFWKKFADNVNCTIIDSRGENYHRQNYNGKASNQGTFIHAFGLSAIW